MQELALLWDRLTPEERQRVMELHTKDEELGVVACNTHKETVAERSFAVDRGQGIKRNSWRHHHVCPV